MPGTTSLNAPVQVLGLLENPHLFDIDHETGEYLGPVAAFPYFAFEQQNLAYTLRAIDQFGEAYLRRALGARIQAGVNYGSYAGLIRNNLGRTESIQLVGELRNVSMSVRYGRFTKGVPPDDKSLWTFTENTEDNPIASSGVEILLLAASGQSVITSEEQEYLITVINRLLSIEITDVRISVVFLSPVQIFVTPVIINRATYTFP